MGCVSACPGGDRDGTAPAQGCAGGNGDIDESKRRCERLAGFVREAWPTIEPANPYVHNWHIDAICEHLEALTYGRKLERTLSMLLKLKDLRSGQSEA